MESRALRTEHLFATDVSIFLGCFFRNPVIPAGSLASTAAPNASPPKRGDSVEGDALSWIARHCRQIQEGRNLPRGRAALTKGN